MQNLESNLNLLYFNKKLWFKWYSYCIDLGFSLKEAEFWADKMTGYDELPYVIRWAEFEK